MKIQRWTLIILSLFLFANFALAENFNKFFSGNIGDDTEGSKVANFQMRLKRTGNNLSGKYRYNNGSAEISLSGTIDDSNKITLEESLEGKTTGKFEGKIEPSDEDMLKMSGTWTKAGSTKFIGFYADELAFEMPDGVYFDTKTAKEKTKKYDISVSYPQFIGGNYAALNLALKNAGSKNLVEFKKYDAMPEMQNYLDSGGYLEFANNNLAVFRFSEETFTGGAHPSHYTKTFNYDLKNNKILKLADLFKPNSKYLQKLSKLSKEKLEDNLDFEDGIKPLAKNFSNFLITPKGLIIYFNEYQVASYAAGPQEILIPYSELKGFWIKNNLF